MHKIQTSPMSGPFKYANLGLQMPVDLLLSEETAVRRHINSQNEVYILYTLHELQAVIEVTFGVSAIHLHTGHSRFSWRFSDVTVMIASAY
jgi:hypothetical protein